MAYTSLASLMRTMDSVLHFKSPMQSLICDHREDFFALREKISSLEVFLQKFDEGNNFGKMIDLEAWIKEAAAAVEHVIQLRLTESLSANDEIQKREAHERLCNSLQQVSEEIDHVYKESTKFRDKGKYGLKKPLVQYSSSKKDIPNVDKNNIVGRDGEKKRLIADLTRCFSGEPEVIPIVGMGGIGKTTLASDVYDDASIRSHFDVCAWATISQQHSVKEILNSLLLSTKGGTNHKEDESEIADMLRKSLMGKRYLIVLDDMWSTKAWDDVRQCFPSENNGSRILLTTRSTDIARYAGIENLTLQMDFMGSDDSWNLFRNVAFSNETLPSELESIGKTIVNRCQGLPLTIVVVAGLLSKSKRTTEVWETAAENIMSFVTGDPDEQCLHVLGLSFNHLPGDLKACLLYFGVFSEDSEISANRLMRLWMAEGYLKLEEDLEVEGEKCLQDLVDRCLVLVSEKSLDGKKIKSCKVHDLIYEMCLREAKNQNFFTMNQIKLDYGSCWARIAPGHHHLIRGPADDDDDNLLKRTRSIFSLYFTRPSDLTRFNLLRILDISHIDFVYFPKEILCFIWLRYLALGRCKDCFPPEIRRLWNLQIFSIKNWSHPMIFTEQIWELMLLRHLRLIDKFYMPNPPRVSVEEERYLGFPEIHTIQGLSPSSCTKEVISGIRNIKKLGIYGKGYDYESFQVYKLYNNLIHLHHLETLSFKARKLISPLKIPSANCFPATLKKLKLDETHLQWEDLNIIGKLPNLEVLKLLLYACDGEEWHPAAGGFTRLKCLLIRHCALKYWKATNDNFPVLERLFIKRCLVLEEIPLEFADILTLQLIELSECAPKLKASATRIQQEQQDLGNEPVHVRFNGEVVIPGVASDGDEKEEVTSVVDADDGGGEKKVISSVVEDVDVASISPRSCCRWWRCCCYKS